MAELHYDDCGGATTKSQVPPLTMTVNGGSCVQGKFGKAYRINNANEGIYGPDARLPSGTGSWTFATWIKRIPGSPLQGIFFFGTDNSKQRWYISGAGGKINLDPNGGSHTFEVTPTVAPPTWEFLQVEWDGTTSVMYVKLYTARGEKQEDSFKFTTPASVVKSGYFYVGNYNLIVTGAVPCGCLLDDTQIFAGRDKFGRVWASYWKGVSKGY